MPTCHNYYPVKHGKNPADRASGRVKLTFKRGKLSREATIRNARELFKYTAEAMNKKVDFSDTRCNHFETKIMFKGKIRRGNVRDSERVEDTKKIHSVRSTGVQNWVQIPFTTCCCLNCMCNSGPCQYPEYADQWKWRCMTDMKADSDNLVMTHWKHHVSERKLKELMLISTKRLTEFEERKEKVYTRFLKKEGMRMKKKDNIGNKSGTESSQTGHLNLHKKMKEKTDKNDKHPKKAVKCKLFKGMLPNECKIKKKVLPFTEVKTNVRKRKSLDKIEVSDDEENKENIPMNVPIGNVRNKDFWTRTHEEIMMQSSFSEAVEYLKCTPFPELVTNFHTVMSASDRVDKISLHLYPPDGHDGLMPRCDWRWKLFTMNFVTTYIWHGASSP